MLFKKQRHSIFSLTCIAGTILFNLYMGICIYEQATRAEAVQQQMGCKEHATGRAECGETEIGAVIDSLILIIGDGSIITLYLIYLLMVWLQRKNKKL